MPICLQKTVRGIIGLFAAIMLILGGRSQAKSVPGNDPVAAPFEKQIALIDEISDVVERVDLPRLMIIRSSVDAVISDMKANLLAGRKEVTFHTARLMENLFAQYRISQSYLGWTSPPSLTSIYTEAKAPQIDELKQISDHLAVEYGLDNSSHTSYTQITANIFRQMQGLLEKVQDLPLDGQLKNQLRVLWRSTGDCIVTADQGTRLETVAKAVQVIKQIRDDYPLFDRISGSQPGFQMIVELRGLSELYAEFAGIQPQ